MTVKELKDMISKIPEEFNDRIIITDDPYDRNRDTQVFDIDMFDTIYERKDTAYYIHLSIWE